MTTLSSGASAPATLEQLLRRQDIWRGYAQRVTPSLALPTGFEDLDAVLLNQGWPLGSLIEICQQGSTQADWCLLLQALLNSQGLIVLLNPPELPFAQGLIQRGMDLERLVIVQCDGRANFLHSFVELCRSGACDAVLAWQPKQALTYTHLRKCLLAADEAQGLYVLFRSVSAQQQNSPAALRLVLDMHASELHVTIFKQRGMLQKQDCVLKLPLPQAWQPQLPHRLLIQGHSSAAAKKTGAPRKPIAITIPFRGRA
jgi:protein ImuA